LSIENALTQDCIGDTSCLSYLIFSGHAFLLNEVLKKPIHIPRGILDPEEPKGAAFLREPPLSELLRPLFIARRNKSEKFLKAETFLKQFLHSEGTYWSSIDLTDDELNLALELRKPTAWNDCEKQARIRRGLDSGESEVAVSITRNWTLFSEDQAAVDLLTCKKPNLKVVRICGFLVHAVERNLIECAKAAELFNKEICGELGFYAKKGNQCLRLVCSPARCEWQTC
jgi:predicted nucleic acid-binding protein